MSVIAAISDMIEILLKAQRHDDPGIGRQFGDQRPQQLAEQRIVEARRDAWLMQLIDWQLAPALRASHRVDTAIARHAPEPEHQMPRRLDTRQILMKGEEHVLRELFRLRPALQEVIRQPEDHRLVLPHERGECAFAAGARLRQKLVAGKGGGMRQGGGRLHHYLIRSWTRERVHGQRVSLW